MLHVVVLPLTPQGTLMQKRRRLLLLLPGMKIKVTLEGNNLEALMALSSTYTQLLLTAFICLPTAPPLPSSPLPPNTRQKQADAQYPSPHLKGPTSSLFVQVSQRKKVTGVKM